MVGRQARRLASVPDATVADLTTLLPEDLRLAGPHGSDRSQVDAQLVENLLGQLYGMAGLTQVKQEVASVVDLIASAAVRASPPVDAADEPSPDLRGRAWHG